MGRRQDHKRCPQEGGGWNWNRQFGLILGIPQRFGMLLLLLVGFVRTTASATDSSPSIVATPTITTPHANWLPSYIASLGQGSTLIAMECQVPFSSSHQPAVLLVSHSPTQPQRPTSRNRHSANGPATKTTTQGGLQIQDSFPMTTMMTNGGGGGLGSTTTTTPSRAAWNVLSPTVVCAMMGFRPDVDYLQRQCAHWIQVHDYLYPPYKDNPNDKDSTETNGMFDLRTSQLVERLGRVSRKYLDRTTRLLAVQTLVVGWHPPSWSSCSLSEPPACWRLYTLDPSGTTWSWNGGLAVVGRMAAPLRRALAQSLIRLEEPHDDNDKDDDQDKDENETTDDKDDDSHGNTLSPSQALQAIGQAWRSILHEAAESSFQDAASTTEQEDALGNNNNNKVPNEPGQDKHKHRSIWRRRPFPKGEHLNATAYDQETNETKKENENDTVTDTQAWLLWQDAVSGQLVLGQVHAESLSQHWE